MLFKRGHLSFVEDIRLMPGIYVGPDFIGTVRLQTGPTLGQTCTGGGWTARLEPAEQFLLW